MSDFTELWKNNFSSEKQNTETYKKSEGDSATETEEDNTTFRSKSVIFKAVGVEILKSTICLMDYIKQYLKEYDTYTGGSDGNDTSEETTKSNKEVNFDFLIEKAYVVDVENNRLDILYDKYQKNAMEGEIDFDNMYIEGVASTINVDHDQERMAEGAIDLMLEKINADGVPLQNEHQKNWDSTLGTVFKAWRDDRGQLYIKAKLDKDNSRAVDLYRALRKGLQVGLSVAGLVKRSAQELVEGLGKKVKTFYDVALKEISVTNRPSNFDSWLIAKGQNGSLKEHLFKETHPFYTEYVKSYPLLNWQFEIAKSVAEVNNNNITNMAEETKQEEVVTPVETPVEVKEGEEQATLKSISGGIETLNKTITDFIKAMESTTATETTTTEADKKKTAKAVADGGDTTSTDEDTEEEETVEAKKKTAKKSIDLEEVMTEKDIAAVVAKEIRKSWAVEGKRVMGPLEETIEKMMKMPLKRKGIATELGYVLEKKFSGNPEAGEGEEEGGEEEVVKSSFQKDLDNKDVTFADVFKKHFSSYK